MTGFITPLKLEIGRGQDWRGVRLIEPLIYRFDEGGRIVVPPGFHSDLASIPASLRWIVGKLEAMTNSGVGRIKRRAMYFAVRIFGRFYWR